MVALDYGRQLIYAIWDCSLEVFLGLNLFKIYIYIYIYIYGVSKVGGQ